MEEDSSTIIKEIIIQVDEADYLQLEAAAALERRTPEAQAEVFVLTGLKLWPRKAAQKPAAKPATKVRLGTDKPDPLPPTSISRLGAE